ncbi:MAG: VanZ family protein [Chitinophagaceae bacterium]|nr:VanZ family protein [Chitinophagaceae bacterium]
MRKPVKFIYFIPAIVWFLFITTLFLLPGDDLPSDSWFSKIPHFDKIVHMGFFGGLIFWSFIFFIKKMYPNNKTLLWVTILACLYGVSIEFMQKYFSRGRGFEVMDMVFDTIGAFLAYFFIRWMIVLVQKKKSIPPVTG